MARIPLKSLNALLETMKNEEFQEAKVKKEENKKDSIEKETTKETANTTIKKPKKKSVKRPPKLPVIIDGRKITTTWWGNAWCSNLEGYADFENRLPRGKTYARNGSIVDLQIEEGLISARVLGRRVTPYKIFVKISPLVEEKYKKITDFCSNQIQSLEMLVKSEFPEELKSLFLNQKEGLFPSPSEIRFSCNCPDWAYMCKHVAAVLYGIGNRLDKDPLLFFTLRGIDMNLFIKKSVNDRVKSLLDNSKNVSSRVIDSSDVKKIFGEL